MGSFNYGCLISSASIRRGDRVGAIALIPNRFTYGDREAAHTHATDQYVPIAAPIYGIYDEYGAIKDIEPSPILDYLSDVTEGLPIEILMQMAGARDALDERLGGYFYPAALPYGNGKYLFHPFTMEEALEQGFSITSTEESETKWSTSKKITLSYDHDGDPIEVTITEQKDKKSSEHGLDNSHENRAYLFMEDNSMHGRSLVSHWLDFIRSVHAQTGMWLCMDKQKNAQWNAAAKIVFTFFLPEAYDTLVNSEPNVLRNIYSRGLERFQKDYEEFNHPVMGYLGAGSGISDVLSYMPLPPGADVYAHMHKHPEHWNPLFIMLDVLASVNRIYSIPVIGEANGNSEAESAIGNFLIKRAEAWAAENAEWAED